MSNPCVNRWGLTTFWHNYWHSDLRYSLYLQQDKLFTTLVQLYLAYGTVYGSIFFQNLFWYKSTNKESKHSLQTYYRWVTTRGREDHEIATSRLRLTSPETFHTRISLLRLNSWFLINIYWFQPDKQKNKRAKRSSTLSIVSPTKDVQATWAPFTKLNTTFLNSNVTCRIRSTHYSF